MSSCMWHRPVVGCVYELSVKWHNGVWVFDNIFVGYPDGDPQSLRLACSRGDSGMGCCTAPLEGTPATNPSFQEVRKGHQLPGGLLQIQEEVLGQREGLSGSGGHS